MVRFFLQRKKHRQCLDLMLGIKMKNIKVFLRLPQDKAEGAAPVFEQMQVPLSQFAPEIP